ncbi:hypothetical protein [Oceanirhabdus seepicola]|uniref:Uncharacterized protein n=1 Tax=Oceanirhabdus seepicola TaxID=2828781 RepID=A0A9J6P078_9CLOT|nr:hypothetical protein [Oceanirhabdus seepicola]MCM1990167.1 hypothetical protein [Oceanirhabdus seepicola]
MSCRPPFTIGDKSLDLVADSMETITKLTMIEFQALFIKREGIIIKFQLLHMY